MLRIKILSVCMLLAGLIAGLGNMLEGQEFFALSRSDFLYALLLVTLTGLLAYCIEMMVLHNYHPMGRVIGIWLIGLFTLISAKTFFPDLKIFAERIKAEIIPGSTASISGNEVRVYRGNTAMFYVDGTIKGQNMRFMFDTGASSVSLSHKDAAKIGIHPKDNEYNIEVSTANGIAKKYPAQIESLTIGTITVKNISAFVSKPDQLDESLLGQAFLSKLKSYEVTDNYITFRGR